MGANSGKLSFLTYDEAVKRIAEDELQRIRETVKRHSANTNVLSKSVFCTELLSEVVPSKLAELLYAKCGGGSKGIGFREALVLLVLITNGTIDEKARFLFHLLSVDGNIVTRKDLEKLYFLCNDNACVAPSCIAQGCGKKEKLNYEDFFEWVISNSNYTSITSWLLEEQLSNRAIKISDSITVESFYSSLSKLTKLSEEDIIELEKRYWALKAISLGGKFDLQTFKVHVCPVLPEQFLQGLFQFFDKNNDGHIDFKEFVCSISLCCRGSNTERLRACFEMFDADGDSFLSKDELLAMSVGLFQISEQYGEKVDLKSREEFMDSFKEYENLSLNEFQFWAYSSPFVYEFLLLLSQICHIVFGLCPLMKKEEGNIVRRWIERESARGLQFGSLYYIVSISWWDTWKKYVSFDVPGASPVQLIKKNSDGSWFDEIIDATEPDGHTCDDSILKGDKNHFSLTNESSLKTRVNHMSSRSPTPDSPGSIINANLIEPGDNRKLMVLTGEGGKLKEDVVWKYGENYQVVSEPVWKALSSWYDSDVPLPRVVNVDSSDSFGLQTELELYPIQIDLYRHTHPPKGTGFSVGGLGLNNIMSQIYSNIVSNTSYSTEQAAIVTPKRTLEYSACFSQKTTIRQVLDFLSHRLKIQVEDLRLWLMYDDEQKEIMLLEEEFKVVGDICSSNEGKLLVEVRNQDLSWPEEMSSLVTTQNFRERSNTGPLEKGATGLHNLGNTCFMNSAIQCLSNTKPLTQYFSKKLFKFELNLTNPLGMKGMLAKRYGDVIVDLWSGIYRSIAPVKLRYTLGRYAPRFNGFQQHDSQEFLSFLLDGLHEDVNRVHDKPYVELNDSNGRLDCIVANEAWQNHLKRNQSIFVDLFQGQLKSQVRCLHCSHRSVTFDPFTFLSLPLPMESSIHLEIPVFWRSGDQPKRYGILLSKTDTIKTLKCKLSALCSVSVDNLLLAQVCGPTIIKFIADELKADQNLSGYTFAYELENNCNSKSKETLSTAINSTVAANIASSIDTNEMTTLKTNSSHVLRNIMPTRVIKVVPTDCTTSHNDRGSLDDPKGMFIIAMHRKVVQSNHYFLSWQKFRTSLFGVPLVLSYHNQMTNKELYTLLWQHVSKYVTGVVLDHTGETKYPFTLKTVDKEGKYCSLCQWYKFCRGCNIECNNSKFGSMCTNVAIDWDNTTLHLHYQQSQERNFSDDSSIQKCQQQMREPISLEKCLKDFTKEEKLGEDEMWYCSKCQEHRTIAKKLDIWKLPPLFIVHLKRFHLVNNRWIKSNKSVRFPITSFDPSMFVAKENRTNAHSCFSSPSSLCLQHCENPEKPESATDMSASSTTLINSNCSNTVADDENMEETGKTNEYSLYAMSCHSGMLNGGHYITFAKNPNGKWYCFNDSSCKEVHHNSIEKESPYMLFFENVSLDYAKYMPDISNKETVKVQMEEEDFEKEVKKYCSVM